MDQNINYDDIRPYTDEEAVEALKRIAAAPELEEFSDFLFPTQPFELLKKKILSLKSVDEYQELVMAEAVEAVIRLSAKSVTYSGLGNIKDGKKHLLLSNHRDIILDPAIIQLIFCKNDVPTTEIAVGDNLISSPLIEDIFRSNRMIKVVRGGTPREKYTCSVILSNYIRSNIVSGKSSIWIAQRNGRTKDGKDLTGQGVLKMLEMSGSGDFLNDFAELSIIPVSISYQFEPCDFLKARELYITRRIQYVKRPGEDTNSILTGVKQYKGRIHFNFGNPISADEITPCSLLDKNERYIALGKLMDQKITTEYKLWDNNYIAYDILHSCGQYRDKYTPEGRNSFIEYMENGLSEIVGKDRSVDVGELREIFLSIYANPICF